MKIGRYKGLTQDKTQTGKLGGKEKKKEQRKREQKKTMTTIKETKRRINLSELIDKRQKQITQADRQAGRKEGRKEAAKEETKDK